MNVLIISKDATIFETSKDTFGDTRKRHILYAKELRKQYPGSSISIIAYTTPGKRFDVQEIDEGITLYPTNSICRAFFVLGVIRMFFKMLRKVKPDIVTVQTPYEEGFFGLFLSRIAKAKYLPQLHFDLFSESWKKEHWMNGWRRKVASWVIRHSDGVRVVSEVLKGKVNKYLGVDKKKIYLLPVGVNFIPLEKAETNDSKKAEIDERLFGKRTVLFVGRFCEQKNLKLWVDVAEKVIESVEDAHFILAGDGELMPEIRKYAGNKKLLDKFIFLGSVGHQLLPKVYAAADVFLLSSNYEGYGRVIVESYLAGVPVVSTKCTGPEDLIIDGKTGFLHELNDAKGLTDSVTRLLKDKELNELIAKEGRKRIESEFSTEVLVTKLVTSWITLYRSN